MVKYVHSTVCVYVCISLCVRVQLSSHNIQYTTGVCVCVCVCVLQPRKSWPATSETSCYQRPGWQSVCWP